MIDFEKHRDIVAKGLKDFLGIPIIQSNQNAPLPKYPFGSYTVTTLMGVNGGSYGIYEDGTERKPFPQIWSLSFLSDTSDESVSYACKAREWFDRAGNTYLSDNGVIVQSVGGVTNRDNILSVEYEYKNGFDVTFVLFDTIEGTAETEEYIETAEINGINVETPPTVERLFNNLAKRLDVEVV